MKRKIMPAAISASLALPVAISLAILGTTPAPASPAPPPVPGGPIETLPLGTYTCELPGAPGAPVGKEVKDHQFRVVNASAYKSGGIRGSYLRTGNKVVMTGGKLKGFTLQRVSEKFLRELKADGSLGDMRCVLTSHH